MDHTGLLSKFKVNRPLTEEERQLQLRQSDRLEVDMIYQRSVIRMNSTYLETTDKFYRWVGWLTLGMFLVGGMVSVACAGMFWIGLHKISVTDFQKFQLFGEFGLIHLLLLVSVLSFPLITASVWGIHREAFRHTHYPIRFNRKTRMVHAFRYDGSTISAPWDKLFFTLGRGNRGNLKQNWDIRVHVLAEDGVTVLDTFSLGDDQEDQDLLRRFWEMHRRYMEEGPREIEALVRYYMPLENGKRETFLFGCKRWWVNFQPSFAAFWIMAPFVPFFASARWLAMRSSKVPQWPAEIEAECRIEPNDKFERDARNNPTDTWAMWR